MIFLYLKDPQWLSEVPFLQLKTFKTHNAICGYLSIRVYLIALLLWIYDALQRYGKPRILPIPNINF